MHTYIHVSAHTQAHSDGAHKRTFTCYPNKLPYRCLLSPTDIIFSIEDIYIYIVLEVLEVMRCVLLYMLKVVKVVRCMPEAVEVVLCSLEALKAMRCMLLNKKSSSGNLWSFG